VLDRLRFITDAKRLGFSLKEIKELLSLGVKSTTECGPVTRKAETKLAAMNKEIARLQRLRLTLRKMVETCGGQCAPTQISREAFVQRRTERVAEKRRSLWKS
jgi:MerR family transcriptional regulator, copper efflux regulator